MDIITFTQRVQALETRLSDRGFALPHATTWLNFCGNLVFLKVDAKINPDGPLTEDIRSPDFKANTLDEIEGAFAALEEWIDEQKTPEERRLEDFTKNLAFMVEEGRALDLPILPDLEATMKRLSENIIEFHAA